MTSIEFGKKCRKYNLQYKEIFGYVPCPDNYICNQEEFFNALLKSIETKHDIGTFIVLRSKDDNRRY
jgi:hypothetical protein